MKVPVLLCLAAVCVQAHVRDRCTQQSQCDTGECCQILNNYLIASKRQLVDILQGPNREGTCQRYRLKDEHCGMFEHENGYCGCGPGLECRSYEVKLNDVNNPPVRRSMIAPRPGYTWVLKCAP